MSECMVHNVENIQMYGRIQSFLFLGVSIRLCVSLQIPVFLTAVMAVRRMSATAWPGFDTGEPSYILEYMFSLSLTSKSPVIMTSRLDRYNAGLLSATRAVSRRPAPTHPPPPPTPPPPPPPRPYPTSVLPLPALLFKLAQRKPENHKPFYHNAAGCMLSTA